MKTTLTLTSDPDSQKWYVVDVAQKVLGRVAPTIANKLRGKDKPTFTPHTDCGDFVIVINADKIRLTGNKMEKKIYYTHSGFPGGIKEEKAEDLLKRKPGELVKLAVYGMLPKNKLRKNFMDKLKIYAGESHPHEAQNPEALQI